MASDVVPSACHQIEAVLRYLRRWTPKVLMRPWEARTAAKMPRIGPGEGVQPVPIEIAVAMKLAEAKLRWLLELRTEGRRRTRTKFRSLPPLAGVKGHHMDIG